MDAIVLCGGLGTRLRVAVADRPKPMADVAGRPLLEHLLTALRERGIERAVLATGFGAEAIAAYFDRQRVPGIEVRCIAEPAPLGTGGAARNALDLTTGDYVLVLNGDSYTPFEPARLKAAATDAALWLVRVDDAARYGAVELGPNHLVTAFREKGVAGPGLISAGIYLFGRTALAALPVGQAISLEREVLPALAARGALAAVGGEGPFLDIGTPASYAQAPGFFAAVGTRA